MVRALLAVVLLVACSGEPNTPEEEIAALVERFERAAGERDVAAAVDLVSDAYRDPAGNDKRAIKALVVRYFLGHEAIHVFSRIRSLELGEPPATAELELVAALTGAPVEEPGELASLSADLYRFELAVALEDDGDWRIRSARWRPAAAGDFF